MTFSVQNHIHLSLALGTAPENAPTMVWKTLAVSRRHIPTVFIALDRALDGTLQTHVLQDDQGVVKINDFKFTVVVAANESQTVWQRLDDLLDMYGKEVFFCDHHHPNDGQDHTTAVKPMVLSNVGEIPPFEPLLTRFYVDIMLSDNSI